MAYIRKTAKGWRAEVERNGVRQSATRETKSAAVQWAAAVEAEILAVKRGAYPRKTFSQALDRYVEEVSARKKGERFERLRIEALVRDFPKLAGKQLSEVTTPDLAAWRDARLAKVTPGSVQRDINVLSNVFTVARREWKWCGESPFEGLRAPGQKPRPHAPSRYARGSATLPLARLRHRAEATNQAGTGRARVPGVAAHRHAGRRSSVALVREH